MAEIAVRVTPKSSRNAVVVEAELIRVYVTAPPADGSANKAVIEVLSKALGVPKSSLEIVRGLSSREKTVSVPALTSDEIRARLA